MNIYQEFLNKESELRKRESWALAWFLAYEFMQRFYRSHGYCWYPIAKEGLGYYGLKIMPVPCSVHLPRAGHENSIGRFSMMGDVENWQNDGIDRLPLAEWFTEGRPLQNIVKSAIEHLRLPAMPVQTHVGCRHNRWGASYLLVFEIAAILAIRHADMSVFLWNDPEQLPQLIDRSDLQFTKSEHPGGFAIGADKSGSRVFLRGDGQLITPHQRLDLWQQYMTGVSASELADRIENLIK